MKLKVKGYTGVSPLLALIALIIGNIIDIIPKTINPNKPKPNNNIKGTHIKQFTIKLNWKLIMFFPCVSIWYTFSFWVSHKINGNIKLPKPVNKVIN